MKNPCAGILVDGRVLSQMLIGLKGLVLERF
jgi:hypothetical protein